MQVNIKTVGITVERYKEPGAVNDRPEKGVKSTLSIRKRRWIVRQAKVKRRITSLEIKHSLKIC